MIPRSRRRYSQGPTCPPGWTWLLAGILIGMFLSFLIYLQEMDSSAPSELEVAEVPIKETSSVEANTKTSSLTPRFEFYDILPQSDANSSVMAVSKKVVEPPSSPTVVKAVTSPATRSTPKQNASSAQLLQVGAFRNAQEAEGLKAHLALLGVKAQVRASSEDNTGVWHRVEVGPIRNFSQLEYLQAKLRSHNIAFILQTVN
jgi:cell division protein FtsN